MEKSFIMKFEPILFGCRFHNANPKLRQPQNSGIVDPVVAKAEDVPDPRRPRAKP